MRAADLFRGKRKWVWLAFALPAAFVSIPLLFFVMVTGTRLLSSLIGPVNIWNSTREPPSPQALAGFYQVTRDKHFREQEPNLFLSEGSGLRLASDHSVDVIDLPAFDGFGKPLNCHYDGTGTWSLYEGGTDIQLNLNITKPRNERSGSLPSCGKENFGLIELLGHSAPFTLWYDIGDPDEEQGLLYHRTN